MMDSVIRKWGNSPALRLPAAVMNEAAFYLEQKVRITATRGRIVIEPSATVEYDLAKLIGGITSNNQHAEFSYSAPVGKEAL
jgi:antitoxin MazE